MIARLWRNRSTWDEVTSTIGMLGCERTPQTSSTLKNESPARTVSPGVVGISCSKDFESIPVTISHLLGRLE